ncbi:7983_t:CDS:2 [Gigaspora rosea]|nr:7983_t:CDS:2 [Gigaspora rosea]
MCQRVKHRPNLYPTTVCRKCKKNNETFDDLTSCPTDRTYGKGRSDDKKIQIHERQNWQKPRFGSKANRRRAFWAEMFVDINNLFG